MHIRSKKIKHVLYNQFWLSCPDDPILSRPFHYIVIPVVPMCSLLYSHVQCLIEQYRPCTSQTLQPNWYVTQTISCTVHKNLEPYFTSVLFSHPGLMLFSASSLRSCNSSPHRSSRHKKNRIIYSRKLATAGPGVLAHRVALHDNA
jgi:hypothetical protein